MKNNVWKKTAGFLSGKGFYIVLILCVAAIGVSGYVMTRASMNPPAADPLPDLTLNHSESSEEDTEVNHLVTGIPKPTATPTPAPTRSPSPTPVPTAAPKKLFFLRPVNGRVGTDFSGDALVYSQTLNDWRVHAGIDIAAEAGTQVRAAADGRVSAVEQDGLLGTVVEITHAEGYVTRYAGLQEQPAVSVGAEVSAGDVIGGVGTTAISEAIDPVHLHFEVWKDGVAIDPETVLPVPAN